MPKKLPPTPPPGEFAPVESLKLKPTLPREAPRLPAGSRLPEQANAAPLGEYADVSPPRAADPLADVMQSPPAPVAPMPQLKKA